MTLGLRKTFESCNLVCNPLRYADRVGTYPLQSCVVIGNPGDKSLQLDYHIVILGNSLTVYISLSTPLVPALFPGFENIQK